MLRRAPWLLLALAFVACSAPPPPPANIVLIVGDDMAVSDVGASGGALARTPNLDRLAAEGVRFTQAYANGPVCTPSRAAILSGRHPRRTSARPSEETGVAYDLTGVKLLPGILRAAGYVTGAIGKWHLGKTWELRPLAQGFDEFFGFLGGGRGHYSWSVEPDEPLWRNGRPLGRFERRRRGYLTELFSEAAADFVRRHHDRRFFLYLSYSAAHIPYQVPDAYLERIAGVERSQRRLLLAMVAALDDGVGLLLDTLDELGVARDTLVVFVSDNGGAPIGSDNAPLRGGKGKLYEGGIRVPLFARWPAGLPSGAVFSEVVQGMDLFPTLLGAAGLPEEARADGVEGVDLLPFVHGRRRSAPHPVAFWAFKGWTATRRGDLKLVTGAGDTVRELFDLAKDPSEVRNLSEERPDVVSELDAANRAWHESLGGPPGLARASSS